MPDVGEGGSLNFAAMNRFDELVAGGEEVLTCLDRGAPATDEVIVGRRRSF